MKMPFRGLFTCLTLLGMGFGLWTVIPGGRGANSARRLRAELIAEMGPVRPLEARLVGLEHAPLGTRSLASRSVREIAREIEKSAGREPSPEALGALAILMLLGDHDLPTRLHRAIELLEQATANPSAGAHLWNDLAAVYLESAGQGEPWLYVRGLEAASHAIQADPDLPEARYNLALALQRNFLVEEAREAWDHLARIESDVAWRGEAAAHLHVLEAPTRLALWERRSRDLEAAALRGDLSIVQEMVGEEPFRSRRHAEDVLLPGWAEAHALGLRERADQKLRAARVVGAVLAAERSEHMAEDSVAALDRLIRSRNGDFLTSVAIAYGDLNRGATLCVENQGALGEQLLSKAREVFEKAGSPVSTWIDYHLGVCAFQRSDRRRAIALLQKTLATPDVGRYPSLQGRAQWMTGLSHMMLGEPAAAAEAYEAALGVLTRTGALPEISGINQLFAENRVFLGDRRQAWVFLHNGLGLAVADGDPRRLYTGLDKTADAAVLEGRVAAAMFLRSALVREALAQGDDPGVAHAFLRRAETHLQAGQREAAQSDLDRAKAACARIEDPDEHRRREADILLAEGKLLSSDQPEAALSSLGRALDIYGAVGNRYPLVGAHLARARALLKLGRMDSAQKDILAGIEEFERQRSEIQNEELRIAHFDQARELFDLLIDLQGKGSAGAERAFNSAEQMRARVLLDRTRGGRAARPLSLRDVLPRLPSGVSVVAYASLPERLLVWVLRRDVEPAMVETPVTAKRLEELVSSCRRDIQRQAEGEDAPACLMDLHERVLSPVLSQIPAGDRIVFVPDLSLHRLPFAALRNRKTGRFLVEDHASAVTPSASLYVEGNAPALMGAPSLLVVADPHFDRGRFPLVSLDGALKEAGQIAGLFGDRALVLKEENATREAFLQEVGRHTIVHLGTHAVFNPEHPHLSQLLLARADGGDAGALSTAEIERLSLPKTRLVFLASCRSAGGALTSEGVLSLARSFLAAGAPQVVASFWDLDDEPATALTLDFYDRLRAGVDAQTALRQAQLKALGGPEEPPGGLRVWAAFQVVVR